MERHPHPYPTSEERFLGSPLKPGSPADPISSWWVRWAPVQSRAAFYTSNTWGVSNFQNSKIVLGYYSEVRDCLSKPSATSRFESLACFYALSFGKGRRTKPHFQLPNFIRSQIQNHRPLSPKIPPPTKKRVDSNRRRQIYCLQYVIYKLSKEPSWAVPLQCLFYWGGGELTQACCILGACWWQILIYLSVEILSAGCIYHRPKIPVRSSWKHQFCGSHSKRCFLKVCLKLPEKISPSMVSFGNCGTKTVVTHFLLFLTQIFHSRETAK